MSIDPPVWENPHNNILNNATIIIIACKKDASFRGTIYAFTLAEYDIKHIVTSIILLIFVSCFFIVVVGIAT